MGKTYLMSDLHGHYDIFLDMLEKIKFKKTDKLYILGDVIDRGPKGLSIIKYIMEHDNITLLRGNHEEMMLQTIYIKEHELTDKESLDWIEMWLSHGGDKTIEELSNPIFKELFSDIVLFLNNLPEYEILTIKDKKYLLVHAGIVIPNNYNEVLYNDDKLIQQNIIQRYHLWEGHHFLKQNIKKLNSIDMIITGHTPTCYLPNWIENMSEDNLDRCKSDKIYKDDEIIILDCGVGKKNRNLGCLCLDTFEEFYIINNRFYE